MFEKYEALLETISRYNWEFEVPNSKDSIFNADRNPILRHDVDFSLTGLQECGALEEKYGHRAIYFFRLDARTYNLMSQHSLEIVKILSGQGHKIGLHIDSRNLVENIQLESHIVSVKNMIDLIVGSKIEFFSWHRPLQYDLHSEQTIENLTSIYSIPFWKKEHYLSDSAGTWDESKLLKLHKFLEGRTFFQLLIHPEWWVGNNASKSFAESYSTQILCDLTSLETEIRSFGELNLERLTLDLLI